MSYLDRYGNITAYKNQQSENPTTFNVAFYFSNHYLQTGLSVYNTYFRTVAKYATNHEQWRTMEYDLNPDFSIDEKQSALALFAHLKDKEMLKRIPTFPSWNNSSKWSWFRPDVLAYTIGSKYPRSRWLMWPIVMIKCWISLGEYDKHPAHEASGAQLAFIKAMGWGKIKKDKENTLFWKGVFDNYYPMEPEHPTRKVWAEYFMGENNER